MQVLRVLIGFWIVYDPSGTVQAEVRDVDASSHHLQASVRHSGERTMHGAARQFATVLAVAVVLCQSSVSAQSSPSPAGRGNFYNPPIGESGWGTGLWNTPSPTPAMSLGQQTSTPPPVPTPAATSVTKKAPQQPSMQAVQSPAATPAAMPAQTQAATPATTPAATRAQTPAQPPANTAAPTPAATPAATPAVKPAQTPAAMSAATPKPTQAAAPQEVRPQVFQSKSPVSTSSKHGMHAKPLHQQAYHACSELLGAHMQTFDW